MVVLAGAISLATRVEAIQAANGPLPAILNRSSRSQAGASAVEMLGVRQALTNQPPTGPPLTSQPPTDPPLTSQRLTGQGQENPKTAPAVAMRFKNAMVAARAMRQAVAARVLVGGVCPEDEAVAGVAGVAVDAADSDA